MSEKRTVTVELLGMRLPIRTTQSATEVERVALLLKSRIDEIQRVAGAVDSLRVALLAGLDVCRELVEAQGQLEELKDMTAERTLALVERLEAETAIETLSDPDDLHAKKSALV